MLLRTEFPEDWDTDTSIRALVCSVCFVYKNETEDRTFKKDYPRFCCSRRNPITRRASKVQSSWARVCRFACMYARVCCAQEWILMLVKDLCENSGIRTFCPFKKKEDCV